MFKSIFVTIFCSILPTQNIFTLEKELNQHLENFSPIGAERDQINKEQEALNNRVQENNKKNQTWGEKGRPLLEDIIKDARLNTSAKTELIKKFLTTVKINPNDDFIAIRYNSSYFNHKKVEKSFFSFLVSYIVENDARNCPVDLVQELIVMGAKPGSELPISLGSFDYRTIHRDERHDAHCVVKQQLKDPRSDACKNCAQKMDDLFNEYKKSTVK